MKLVYVDPEMPGITRRKMRHGWGYWDAKGNRITDRDEIDRLNRIALPPAYVDAWFCPSPHGHIQAIGYDAKGRKQYRYHLDFRAAREAEKYDRLADFGRALPLLRAQVQRDLTGKPTERDTVIAAIVRLLDLGRIRVGNEAYAKSNKSFGATTLRNRHANVRGSKLSLQYRAKSGVMRKLTISDKSLLRVVRRVQDLPGQNLFQYLDADGVAVPVGSADVNAYIKDAMGDDFSAKHFRTWGASVIALEHLIDACRNGTSMGIKALMEPVAEALGNTPTIARKSYVHPLVIGLVESGFDASRLPRRTQWLSGAERTLTGLLDEAGEAVAKAAA
jgi:DNA topoisomerase I